MEIPLNPGSFEDEIICYNNPEFGFDTVLIFEEDDAIIDWGHGQEVTDKSTLAIGNHFQYPVSVGYIYLTVYNDLSAYYPEIILDLQDLVLLNFGTTGTRMSNLFYYSKSIRTQFTNLLKEHQGVCGIFNMEERGEVFWLNGKPIHGFIDDVWLSPDEIKLKLSHK
ncbi:hypothetical protein JR338_01705 [Chloroflexota bacterium]|nr:hypothetical protein JR338_01705 [Chloroflexota bacterium]